MPTLEHLIKHVSEHLLPLSGGLLYAGREAFSGNRDVYLMGLNPGGREAEQEGSDEADAEMPVENAEQPFSVRQQIDKVLAHPNPLWSEYTDEVWSLRGVDHPAGTHPMQRRVRCLLDGLGLNAGETPASNLLFVRTRGERDIVSAPSLTDECWKFHQAVIDELQVRVIVCFGDRAGRFVREKLVADPQPFDTFQEENDRRWTSTAFAASKGRLVISLPHPSRSDWCSTACNPSAFVKRAIATLSTGGRAI